MRQRNVKNKEKIITNSKYFIENPKDFKGNWASVYKNQNPLHIEIGMGKGKFIIEKATRYPNINFIGIEKQDSILALALKKIDKDLPNLRMIHLDANQIDDVFEREVETIYLNFSDPWPKKRHEKRRLTSFSFLEKYDQIFKEKNHLIMKTDNASLFSYSIQTLNNYGYFIENITFDLASLNDPLNIMTEYEEKFTKLNKPIYKIEVKSQKK